MPHIVINLYQGRSEEAKREIAAKTKIAVASSCEFPLNAVSVSVAEFPADQFFSEMTKRYGEDALYETSDFIK